MTPTSLHPRSIWSPHRDSGCVQVCKSLLSLRGEEWQWVEQPQHASWIVIDASRPVSESLDPLLRDTRQRRYWIALAKSWSEVPSPHWAFFKLPLTPRSFFPWINQNLGLPATSHVDKELPGPAAEPSPASQPWEGQWLRFKHWPNLSAYPGLPLHLVKLCRQMLMEEVNHAQLRQELGDHPMLHRLLADAWRHDNLRISSRTPPAATAPTKPQDKPREPGLFQRFLSRFR